ncbi:MAG: methyltransferase domain-containing protein [Candidatus Zapsychrus exili]|nr:methyltransferase domain-containing protein [Candidatus Zapsychrus exili]
MKEILVIGSAGKKNEDAITLDIDPKHNPDVVHNLMEIPYPFKDNTFKEIVAHHVLEHLDNVSTALVELFRICKPDGEIIIEVPHHTSWCSKSPFHKAYYNYFSLDDFVEGNATWITEKKFRCLYKEITFHRNFRAIFLHKFFNKFPLAYERFFYYIFPAENVKIKLQPVK